MTLHYYVIHEIDKKSGGNATLKPSRKLPEVCELANNLMARLLERYQQEVAYGKFREDGAGGFRTPFQTFCSSSGDGEAFLTFTTGVSERFNEQVQNIWQAVGGYLLFADYERNDKRYLSVYLIRNIEGFQFSHTEERYNIDTIPHLGIDKLAMACRINTESFRNQANDSANYLSFLKGRASTDSGYFYNWIGAEELQQSTVYTQRLIDIFKEIPLPEKMGDIEKPDRDQVRAAVSHYAAALPSRQLSLNELSRHIFGEGAEDTISQYAQKKEIQIAAVFTPNKGKMRGMAKVIIEADDIFLKFPIGMLSDERIVAKNGKVIISSQGLAEKVSAEVLPAESTDGAA